MIWLATCALISGKLTRSPQYESAPYCEKQNILMTRWAKSNEIARILTIALQRYVYPTNTDCNE